MPKRKISDKITYYEQKLQSLREKSHRKRQRRRRSVTPSSQSEEDQDGSNTRTIFEDADQPSVSEVSMPNPQTEGPSTQDEEQHEASPSGAVDIASIPIIPELEPELLIALGDTPEEENAFGEEIHDSLAKRWIPILKKGLGKECKNKLLKEYPVPANCKLFKAPSLNPEISAAVTDVVRNRDKNILVKQDQLGQGIAALNKAITLLLHGEDKVQSIKVLSDSCRILTDLHYTETQVRQKLITPCLDKTFMSVIQDQERDETLFGKNLPDSIKASKAIEKQSHQIKKNSTGPKTTSSSAVSIYRPRYQGNSMGPPRYLSASRGGRGQSHASTSRAQPYRRAPPPQFTSGTAKPLPNQTKQQRAPRH